MTSLVATNSHYQFGSDQMGIPCISQRRLTIQHSRATAAELYINMIYSLSVATVQMN
jgi:hypothetical protein